MKRLLMVDDDAMMLRTYRDRLSAHGFQVNTAPDGAAAITILREAKPDLVVLDLMMPKVSGVEVLKYIRSDKRLATTPVVVLTNAFLNDLGRQAAQIGIEKALLKSNCSPSVLMAVIDELLAAPPPEPAPSPEPAAPALGVVRPPPAPAPPPRAAPPLIQPARAAVPPTARPIAPPLTPVVPAPVAPAPTAPAQPVVQAASSPPAQPAPGGGVDLLGQAPAVCADLRRRLQAVSRTMPGASERLQQLRDFHQPVHFLTAVARMTNYAQLVQLTSVFEALMSVLIEKPGRLDASVQRTLASLVDFVERLFQQARDSRLGAPRVAQVLAVDDDPVSNRLAVVSLQRAQIQARSTENPMMAWQWLQEERFDLVLLDIEMPGLNGFELCKRLRALPGYEKTPVVYVTSHSDFANRAKSTLSGGDDLIAKPILPMELAAKVLMHLLKSEMTA